MTPPVPPLLSNVLSLAGSVSFTVNGNVGHSYIIEITDNFSTWSPIATQMQTTASQPFTDSSVIGLAHRFYRAKVAQ